MPSVDFVLLQGRKVNMSNKSETKRIFLQMSEVTNKIVISLGESISICNKRKNLYFQHYVKEFLNISPDLENRHNEVLRDHKIGYRRFSLIKKKIDDATSKEITHYLVNQIKNDISDAWKFILQTGEKDQNITEELKFIE
jgi:hypothetical protein